VLSLFPKEKKMLFVLYVLTILGYVVTSGVTAGLLLRLEEKSRLDFRGNLDNLMWHALAWPMTLPMIATEQLPRVLEERRMQKLELEAQRHAQSLKELAWANRLLESHNEQD
jgi:hypothetical protein